MGAWLAFVLTLITLLSLNLCKPDYFFGRVILHLDQRLRQSWQI